MRNYVFEPWHFYKINCLVPKSKEDGGGYHKKWKFWFHLVSGEPQDGFFINSKERWGNLLQMKIDPDDINRCLPVNASQYHKLTQESVINFKETYIKSENVFKVETILQKIPKPLAQKTMQFLKANKHHIPNKRMKTMEDTLKKYL